MLFLCFAMHKFLCEIKKKKKPAVFGKAPMEHQHFQVFIKLPISVALMDSIAETLLDTAH